jgi:hypothetical protein
MGSTMQLASFIIDIDPDSLPVPLPVFTSSDPDFIKCRLRDGPTGRLVGNSTDARLIAMMRS